MRLKPVRSSIKIIVNSLTVLLMYTQTLFSMTIELFFNNSVFLKLSSSAVRV